MKRPSSIAFPSYGGLLLTLALMLLLTSPATAGRRVLFIGDSITDGGWGNSGGSARPSRQRNHTDMNHIYGHSYMMLCAAYFQSAFPEEDFEFFNRGISGNTVQDMKERWKEDALDLQPDIVSILIGTNDVHFFLEEKAGGRADEFDLREWGETLSGLILELRNANPDVQVILCTPFVAKQGLKGASEDFPERERLVRDCASETRRLSERLHCLCISFDTMFEALVESQVRESYWIWDGIHPTPAGHRRMADLWIRKAEEAGILP